MRDVEKTVISQYAVKVCYIQHMGICIICGDASRAKNLCTKHYDAQRYVLKTGHEPRIIMTLEQNKEARLKSAREWRKRNPEKQREAVRRCRNTPKAKEAHRNRQLEYAVEHRDQEKLRAAQWRKENPEKSRASQRSSYQANKTSAIQKARIYYRSHKEQAKVWSREYKARKRAGGGRLSRGYVGKMFVDQKGKCSVCRVSLSVSGYHIDHIIALSKGGKHCDQNVQLLCPTCNRRKSAREWTEFLKIMEAENA